MSAVARRRGTLLLIFAVTGGAWAWTLQLWLSWVVGEPLCLLEPGAFTLAGLEGGALWIFIGLVTGALALAALVASLAVWRGARLGNRDDPQPGARRFLGFVGLVLNALLLLTIAMGTTSPIFLDACT